MNEEQITTGQLIEKLESWRKDRLEDYNTNIAGRSLIENTVMAAAGRGLLDDMSMLLVWCETLARRVKELEDKVKE